MKLPSICPICQAKLIKSQEVNELYNPLDFDLFYCENCTLMEQHREFTYNTCFEVRVGKHSEKYLTRISIIHQGFMIAYYPHCDEESSQELIIAKDNGEDLYHDDFGEPESVCQPSDWEDWSNADDIINRSKTILAFL